MIQTHRFLSDFPPNAVVMSDAGWLGKSSILNEMFKVYLEQHVVVFYEADDCSLLLWDLENTERMRLKALWFYWTSTNMKSAIWEQRVGGDCFRSKRNGSHVGTIHRECLFSHLDWLWSQIKFSKKKRKEKKVKSYKLNRLQSMVLYFNTEIPIKGIKTLYFAFFF